METTPATPTARTRKVRAIPAAEPKQRALTATPPKAGKKVAKPITPTPKPASTAKPRRSAVTRKKSLKAAAADAAQLGQQISMAAYYLAEKRGFAPGHELHDWLMAEQQIKAKPKR